METSVRATEDDIRTGNRLYTSPQSILRAMAMDMSLESQVPALSQKLQALFEFSLRALSILFCSPLSLLRLNVMVRNTLLHVSCFGLPLVATVTVLHGWCKRVAPCAVPKSTYSQVDCQPAGVGAVRYSSRKESRHNSIAQKY